jgi:hypothetical protein
MNRRIFPPYVVVFGGFLGYSADDRDIHADDPAQRRWHVAGQFELDPLPRGLLMAVI